MLPFQPVLPFFCKQGANARLLLLRRAVVDEPLHLNRLRARMR